MRYIARLDIKSDYLIKSIRYEGLRNLGTPEKYAKKYYEEGATEIFLIDTVSSLYRREPSFDTIKRVAENISIPLTFCGGIKSLEDVHKAFESGADKIAINTALFSNLSLISEVAEKFGQQSIIGSIEAKQINDTNWECYIYNGRERTDKCVLEWTKELENAGVGEIFISSVDLDGTHLGYDIPLAKKIISSANIPVVIGSGAGSIGDIKKLLSETTPSGIAIGSALHYNRILLEDVKRVTGEE